MPSVLNVDTLVAANGTDPVTLTKQSAAKAWAIKSTDGSSIDGSFAISSLDDDGSGDFGLNFSSSFDSANYAVTATARDNTSNVITFHCDVSKNTQAAGAVDLEVYYNNASSVRNMFDEKVYVTTHGDLA